MTSHANAEIKGVTSGFGFGKIFNLEMHFELLINDIVATVIFITIFIKA
jgi:hypothetical protein